MQMQWQAYSAPDVMRDNEHLFGNRLNGSFSWKNKGIWVDRLRDIQFEQQLEITEKKRTVDVLPIFLFEYLNRTSIRSIICIR